MPRYGLGLNNSQPTLHVAVVTLVLPFEHYSVNLGGKPLDLPKVQIRTARQCTLLFSMR
jgi:hypothetical protein